MDENPDYITVMPPIKGQQCVAVMRYDHAQQEYTMHRCSQALPPVAAQSLAKCWAAAGGLEVR